MVLDTLYDYIKHVNITLAIAECINMINRLIWKLQTNFAASWIITIYFPNNHAILKRYSYPHNENTLIHNQI